MSKRSRPLEGRELNHSEVSALLDGWAAAAFSVGIVLRDNQLVAIYEGQLQRRQKGNATSFFWPVDQETTKAPNAQLPPGVVLDPRHFTGATFHPRSRVVELRHGALTTYVRRL